MYSIGQFSRITGLTIKTVRFYEEKRLLAPSWVNEENGYRYYTEGDVEHARLLVALRELTFSVAEIQTFLQERHHEERAVAYLERKRTALEGEMRRLGQAVKNLDRALLNANLEPGESTALVEKAVPEMRVASMRYRARYDHAGAAFGVLAREAAGAAGGPPLCLYWDAEHLDEDADLQWCLPLTRDLKKIHRATVVTLPAVRVLSAIHVGPYAKIGSSYRALFAWAHQHQLTPTLPTREIYLKGPGMLLKGNPARYRTEVQLPLG